MSHHLSRRGVLTGMAAMTAAAVTLHAPATPAHAAPLPLPVPPPRVPETDQGVTQQPEEKLGWLRDAKLGMFIHWGVYSGPAKGEWHMENDAVPPEDYRRYLTEEGDQQFTAESYDPAAWAALATEMGARYTVLTTRHHDGFSLFPSDHENAWHAGQAPLERDLVTPYVDAVRAAGLRVGLYYSPMSWRYPGYYDVTGTNCLPNRWGYQTDPAHKENARIMKNEVYQQIRELVTRYGVIDDIFYDGGWLGQQGSDADAAFFWEPGAHRDAANEWPVDDAYSETDPATGQPFGISGLVRHHQPDVVANLRSGWIGDYDNEEGPSVPTGAIRTGHLAEKCFTICGSWGYRAGQPVMPYGTAMNILVNAWVRDITCLVNVGPDRTGTIPSDQADAVRAIGAFLDTYGDAVYGTRGGPWNPTDGRYGFTHRDDTFYVHLLPGYSGTGFTTPSVGDGVVRRVFDVATGQELAHSVDGDARVTVTGIDRERHPEDTVFGVTLDRSVVPADIAVGATATASSEETNHGNTAGNAVDGSTATRWCAATGATGEWLTVDLGATRSLTGTRLVWEKDEVNYRYRVEGSTDNTTWSTLADLTGSTDTARVRAHTFTADARYVRVTVTSLRAGSYASIRELELYDRPFGTSPDQAS
ncbi:alpha-L-fucosidase [Streptomyces sp. NBRC 109706]|uniref:alpha-L-fucosidase n=1 Tax=Streptomyces sp. NBRC 109706 TaxID=1550035 RepID=UPI000785747C|nr:alpha-L-fucosidase [Streptomyces sp. NBRC 109706]